MTKELEKVIPLNSMKWNEIEQLAQSMEGKIKVSKLNVDQNQEIAMKYNIQSIPSLVLFKNGNEISRIVGFSPKEKYEKFVNNALNV